MRTTVMEGDFGEFDLASVIQVVSIGRQFTGIEVMDETGQVIGTLFMKSGKILSARSGSASGLDAVSTLLRGTRHKRFSVYRTPHSTGVMRPVGSVCEVLMRLTEDPRSSERVLVMEGSFVDFDLLSVLQVIGIGRQYTVLEVSAPNGRTLGQVTVKAGKVLSAEADGVSGVEAIRRLAGAPRDSRFTVFRSRAVAAEHHLGPLAQIVLKLAELDAWDLTEPTTETKALHPSPKPPKQAPRDGATPQRAWSPASVPAPVAAPAAVPAPAAASAPVAASPPATAPASPPAPSSGRPPSSIPAPGPPAASRALPVAPVLVERLNSTSGAGAARQCESTAPAICVTSPKGGAGKTTVSLNLGVALARQGKRVVLVDADANGILLALNAHARGGVGVHDMMVRRAKLEHVAIPTKVAGLRIVAFGNPNGIAGATRSAWLGVLDQARREADVVLVDTSAGLYGPAGEACAAASHVLVVLPAEPTAIRALPGHLDRLAALGRSGSAVLGIVLNMLDYHARASLDVLRDLCSGPSGHWIFDVPIARSPAFLEAVARGVPVCRGERQDTPTIGWVFEMLASGILERLGVLTPTFDDGLLA
jgi:chromosome partitioning protein